MSEYFFGLGPGWLPAQADTIARKHRAYLVNHTDPQCNCGSGCRPHQCKEARRHWFAGQNLGSPFNQNMAAAVMDDLIAAGLEEPRPAEKHDNL